MKFVLGCSGMARPGTGIGVVQNNLYSHLEKEFNGLVHSPRRDIGNALGQKLLGFAKGLIPPLARHNVYLSTTPPLPVLLRPPVVSVIHDLRWQRTKGYVGRMYRRWDLGRTIRRSASIICISDRTRRDLLEMFPGAANKTKVAWLGPGLMEGVPMSDSKSGRLLLIGGAPHKQNERAARLLANAHPSWLKGIVGIGVSREVQEIVDDAFGIGFGTWRKGITDTQIVEAYRDAQYYMLLGTDEGFGMPFVESLAAGCQVIASEHELARELLGDACVYLTENDEANCKALRTEPNVGLDIRKAALSRFSWKAFSETIREDIYRVSGISSTKHDE